MGRGREKDVEDGSRPDGEMVGDGWVPTPILGVGNETQWQTRAAYGAFAKQPQKKKKSVNSIKGHISPRKNGKVKLSLLVKPAT